MANRVFDTLRTWTLLDDAALDAAMRASGATVIDGRLRRRARQLFALALETPGGLKVQTIHAFCTQHPASVSVRGQCRGALRRARRGDRRPDARHAEPRRDAARPRRSRTPPLGRALATAVLSAADITFRELVREDHPQTRHPGAVGRSGRRRCRRPSRSSSQSLGVASGRNLAAGRSRVLHRKPHRQLRMVGGRRGLCARLGERQGAGRALRRAAEARRCGAA